MKNAKKLLLLVLSLVLLVGVFAVAAFADDGAAEVATVVYPDGATQTFAENETIIGKSFENDRTTKEDAKLYYGNGNTLFKDDSVEGWTFTIEGDTTPLTDLTVTADMLGKKIIAGGVNKVYFTSYEELSIGITMVYHLTDDIVTYFTDSNMGDEGDGIHTGATAYGVFNTTDKKYSGNVLAVKGVVQKLTLTLYNDVEASVMTFSLGVGNYGADKRTNFDLNGHNVTLGKTTGNPHNPDASIDGIDLYVYSSQPGAHFTCTATSAFTPDDQCNFYMGDDGTGKYVDNIYFHVNAIYGSVYGGGSYINGGHFYQLPTATEPLLRLGCRIEGVSNAKFYAKDGLAIFSDSPKTGLYKAATGASPIKDCSFYSFGKSDLIVSVNGATPKFQNCTFYSVNANVPADSVPSSSNTLDGKATAKTVTWLDGTTTSYFADSEEAVKYFVEGHPKALVAPYDYEKNGELYYVASPAPIIEYDAANAVQKETAESVKVYFTVEKDGAVIRYETDAQKYNANFRSYLTAMTVGATVRLWSDISISACSPAGERIADRTLAMNAKYWIDINGYELTITGSGSMALDFKVAYAYLYSSRENGVINATTQNAFFRTNNDDYLWYDGQIYSQSSDTASIYYKVTKGLDGYTKTSATKPAAVVYIGENSTSSTAYGENLTIYCKTVSATSSGTGPYFLGGTFVQVGSTGLLFNPVQRVQSTIKNTTFIAAAGSTGIVAPSNQNTFENCVFICESPVNTPIVQASCAKDMTFKNCNFVNVIPAYPSGRTMKYESCAFGTTGTLPSENLNSAGAAYLAHTKDGKSLTAHGATYQLDGTIVDDPSTVLVVTWHDGVIENYCVGASIYRAYDMIDFVNHTINSTPVYAFTSGVENGVVAAAGTATATISRYEFVDPFAFTYKDEKTGETSVIGYKLDCGETAEGMFAKFYELFDQPASAYTITMYKDMTISKGLGLGTFASGEYASLKNGSITLDLNGTTITVDEKCVGVHIENAYPGQYQVGTNAVFGFEGYSYTANKFTLKSSAPGAQIINNSNLLVIGIGEADAAVINIDGTNLAITSKGGIIGCIEKPGSGTTITVNGGTYIYTGTNAPFSLGRTASIEDAVIVAKNATSVFATPTYSSGNNTLNFTNVQVYTGGRTALYGYTWHDTFVVHEAPQASSYTYVLNFTDCILAGVDLTKTYTRTTINYAGTLVATTEADLLAAMPNAPDGTVIAYTSASYGENQYNKLICYSADAKIVNWGFGITENWVIGSYATHDDATVDGAFIYAFQPLTVAKENNNAKAALVGVEKGALQLTLTLQSKIGMNLLMNPDLFANALVSVGENGLVIETDKETGALKASFFVSPNAAGESVTFTITIGENKHNVSLCVENYAAIILASADYADVQNLTYAMVEYVRAVTKNESFCAGAEKPATYEAQKLEAVAPENDGELLKLIAFQMDESIAIAITGTEDAKGKDVHLVLATTRGEWATVGEDGIALFEGLYINEFFGDMKITIEGETYTYNLANYLYGLGGESAGVQALYNYAFYADAYVKNLPDYPKN